MLPYAGAGGGAAVGAKRGAEAVVVGDGDEEEAGMRP